MPPGKLSPGNKPPKKFAHRKNAPPDKCPPPGKLPAGKLPPRKIVLLDFCSFNIILQFLIFKLFIVASFRGVSRTPVVSIINLLVTVVNSKN